MGIMLGSFINTVNATNKKLIKNLCFLLALKIYFINYFIASNNLKIVTYACWRV